MSGGRVVVVGSLNVDLVARVRHLPLPGETVSGTDLVRSPGGKGLNQAVAAARAGVPVAIVGRVGDDDHGEMLRSMVVDERIDASALLLDPAPTGTALITVAADGSNVIVVSPGANAATDAAQVASFGLRPSDVVVCQAEIPEAAVLAALAAARGVGATTVLNQAPYRPVAPEAWGLVDVLVVNESELAACMAEAAPGIRTPGEVDEPDEARTLASTAGMELLRARPGLGAVLVSLGASGAITVTRSVGPVAGLGGVAGVGADGVEGELHVVAAPQVRATDTVGAGDCLTGWLAAGLAEGRSLGAALGRAVRAAAVAVQRPGAATSMPSADDVSELG
jgi:ribokinase